MFGERQKGSVIDTRSFVAGGFFAVAILCGAALSMADLNIKAEGGPSYSRPAPNYLWNQRDNGHESNDSLVSLYGRIGVDKTSGPVSIGLSAFNLGRFITDNMASDDEPCAMEKGCDAKSNCGTAQRYVTQSSVYGLSLDLGLEYKSFFIEAGPTRVKRKFKLETQREGEPLHERQDLLETNKSALYGYGSFVSLGYREKEHYIRLSMYSDDIGGKWPSGLGTTYLLGFGKRFRL